MLYDEIIHIDKTIPVACKQIIFGDYCEDVTVTGTMGQVIVSFSGIDFIADIRDVTYDCGHWKWSWSHAGKTGLDIIGVLPVIGALKYSDQMVEINKLAKLEDIGDSAKLENRVDEIDDLLKSGKSSSEALELEKEYLSNTVSV